ncbi:MAG: DUF554 domain-containing protein [Bacteroidota bacterium]
MSAKVTHLPIGTFINMAAVALGSLVGLYLKGVFPADIQAIIFQALGLGTLLLGVMMGLKLPEGYFLNFIFSLVIGGIIGQVMGWDTFFNGLGESLKTGLGLTDSQFTEGLITAFLLYCIGGMTFVGAIEEGLEGKRDLLMVKSTLDGISSIAFAATYGVGVLFSIFPMLLFQGGITLLAKRLQRLFTPTMIDQLNAVGGALIVGIGINILGLGDINVENLLPALFVTLPLTWLQQRAATTS